MTISKFGRGLTLLNSHMMKISPILFIQTLVKEWHPTKNGKLTPHDVTPFSDMVVWWKGTVAKTKLFT